MSPPARCHLPAARTPNPAVSVVLLEEEPQGQRVLVHGVCQIHRAKAVNNGRSAAEIIVRAMSACSCTVVLLAGLLYQEGGALAGVSEGPSGDDTGREVQAYLDHLVKSMEVHRSRTLWPLAICVRKLQLRAGWEPAACIHLWLAACRRALQSLPQWNARQDRMRTSRRLPWMARSCCRAQPWRGSGPRCRSSTKPSGAGRGCALCPCGRPSYACCRPC